MRVVSSKLVICLLLWNARMTKRSTVFWRRKPAERFGESFRCLEGSSSVALVRMDAQPLMSRLLDYYWLWKNLQVMCRHKSLCSPDFRSRLRTALARICASAHALIWRMVKHGCRACRSAGILRIPTSGNKPQMSKSRCRRFGKR